MFKKLNQRLNEVLLKSGDYVQRIDTFKQSQNMKNVWQKKRFKYQSAINKSNRLNPNKELRQSFLSKGKD